MTEAEFTAKVIHVAQTFGWRVAHFRPARTAHGWRTAVSGDGKGWPDLTLVHDRRGLVWFRELKVNRGKLDPEQEAWGEALDKAGADWAVWRDRDWDRIVDELSAKRAVVQ